MTNGNPPFRSIVLRLSKRAQRAFGEPGAIVTHVPNDSTDGSEFWLQRPGAEPLGVGRNYTEALRTIDMLAKMEKKN